MENEIVYSVGAKIVGAKNFSPQHVYVAFRNVSFLIHHRIIQHHNTVKMIRHNHKRI